MFAKCWVLKLSKKSLKMSNISQPTLSLPGGQWLRLEQRLRLLPQHERGHKREGVHGGHGPDELVGEPEGQVVGRLPQHALLVDGHLLRDLLVADHAEALACHLLLPLAPRRGRGAVQEDEALLRHLRVHLEGLLPEGLLSGGGFCSGTQLREAKLTFTTRSFQGIERHVRQHLGLPEPGPDTIRDYEEEFYYTEIEQVSLCCCEFIEFLIIFTTMLYGRITPTKASMSRVQRGAVRTIQRMSTSTLSARWIALMIQKTFSTKHFVEIVTISLPS